MGGAPATAPGGSLLVTRSTEQANVVLGTRGLVATDPRRHVMSVLNAVLGGGMSSRLFQEIREQAELDGLTGLYSRRYFDLRLRAEFDAARDAGRALTVALLDVDHFGAVNKTHGWPVGDQVLVELSSRVAQGVRAEDWVARYGGEEFALVLHGLDSSRAALVLERIRAALSASPVLVRGGQTLAVTASIGAATLRPEDDDPAALMERVSERLLAAKRSGRDRVCVVA